MLNVGGNLLGLEVANEGLEWMDVIMKIAVIDDSKAILMVMQTMLTELGFSEVDTYESAVDALECISEGPDQYQLLFIDLNMPVMDGMELMRQLGAIGYIGGIVIVSGMEARIVELASEIAKQNRVFLVGHLPKPVQFDSLRWTILKLKQLQEERNNRPELISREELLYAISHKCVIPYYQPKLDVTTNRVQSVEVLARIVDRQNDRIIMPGAFISVAEEHDLMDMLTMQLIEQTTEEFADLQQQFEPDLHLSFNLSPNQLGDLQCPLRLGKILEHHKVKRQQVTLEITEEYALKSSEQLESLNRFRMQGYGVSLDDFGTGFTNIQQLRSLPFSEIKIDRSLIQGLQHDSFAQLLVGSLYGLAEQLNLTLVAEGIETDSELTYLKTHFPKVLIQGYLICRPAPKDALCDWYRHWCAETA